VLAVSLALSFSLNQAHAGGVLSKTKEVFKTAAQNIKNRWTAAAGKREVKAMLKPGAIITLGLNDPHQAVRRAYAEAQQRYDVAGKTKDARGQRIISGVLLTDAIILMGQPLSIPITIAALSSMGSSELKHEALNEAKDRALIAAVLAAKKNGLEVSAKQKTFVTQSLADQNYDSAGHASWAGHVLSKMKNTDPKQGIFSALKYHFYKAWGKGDAGRTLKKRADDKRYFNSVQEALQ